MLFNDLMFESSLQTKYELLYLLTQLTPESHPIQSIAKRSELNYQQIASFLTEMNQDFQELNPEQASILEIHGRVDLTHFLISTDDYRYYLLQRSIPFQLISYLLNEPRPTLNQFCETHFVSRSTVFRKIRPLVNFLQSYQMRLTYSPLAIHGDERAIRLTLGYLFWLGIRGIDWPFAVDMKTLQPLYDHFSVRFPLHHTYLGRKELTFFLAVFYLRIQHHQLIDSPSKTQQFFEGQQIFTADDLHFFPQLTPEQRIAEANYLNFLVNYAPTFDSEDNPLVQSSLQFFTSQKKLQPILAFNQEFLLFIENELLHQPLRTKQRQLLLANLLNISFSYFYMEKPFPTLEIMTQSSMYEAMKSYPTVEQKITRFLDNQIKQEKYAVFRTSIQAMAGNYINITLPYYFEHNPTKKLKVAIAIEQNQILLMRLKTFLRSLNFIQIEQFRPEHSQDYDLVLTSSMIVKKEFPKNEVYFIDLEYSGQDILKVYQRLQQLYVNSYTQEESE